MKIEIYGILRMSVVLISFFAVLLFISCQTINNSDDEDLISFYSEIEGLLYTNADSLLGLSDSLIIWSKQKGNTEFEILGKITKANAHSFLSAYDRARFIMGNIDSTVLHKCSDRLISKYYSDFGSLYFDQGIVDTAIFHYTRALDIAKTQNDSLKMASNNSNIGSMLVSKGYYEKGIDHLLQALRFVEVSDDPLHKSLVLSSLSAAYNSFKDFDNAIETADNVISILNEKPAYPLVVAMNNKGNALIQLKNYEQAHTVLTKSIEVASALKDSFSLFYAKSAMSEVLYQLGDFEKSKILCEENLVFEEKKSLDIEAADSYVRLAKIYDITGHTSNAKEIFKKAEEKASQSKSKEDIYKVGNEHFKFSLKSAGNNDFQDTYSKIEELRDSLYQDDIVSAIKKAEYEFETEEKEKEIQQLAKLNSINSEKLLWQKWAIAGLILSIGLLFSFLTTLNRKNEIQSELNLKLQREKEELVFETDELKELNSNLQKEILNLKTPSFKTVEIEISGKIYRIEQENLIYITAESDGTRLVYPNENSSWIPLPLKQLHDEYLSNKMIRVHRKYVVSKSKISSFRSKTVKLIDGIELPVGRKFKENLKNVYKVGHSPK